MARYQAQQEEEEEGFPQAPLHSRYKELAHTILQSDTTVQI